MIPYYGEENISYFGEDMDSFYCYLNISRIVSYIMMFVLGIVGNLLVIWITGFRLKSVSAVWFLNLAATDLICNMALLLRIAAWTFTMGWFEDYNLCLFSTSLIFFNMLTSVYFLTIISIDRCVSVICPIWSKIHRTPRLAKIISGIIWILCLIISVHVTLHIIFNISLDCKFHFKYYFDHLDFKSPFRMFLISKLVLVFVVPFLIISICSGLVVFKLKILKKTLGSEKPFRVITAVVLCFFICWCPYSVWPLIPINKKYWKIHFMIQELSICLSYFNSCLNPILYVAFSQHVKTNYSFRSLPARLKTVLNDQDETSGDNPTDNPTDQQNTSL